MQQAANILSELLSTFGLVISIDKTKTMILNFKGDTYSDHLIKINNINIENVKTFKYLVTNISYNEPGVADIELDNRIGMATSKFAQMKYLLCNYSIKLSTRIKFYDVYVKSRLTYCCETWTLTKTQYSKINSVHTNFLRRLIRGGLHRK